MESSGRIQGAGLAPGWHVKARYVAVAFIAMAVAAVLYLVSRDNYLLFHWVAEGFSIVIVFAIFAVAWNSRRFMDNNYLLFLGIAYLFVGSIDFVHTMAYEGMGVFIGHGANAATQLWVSARYLEAFTLLAAPLTFHRKLHVNFVFLAYALATGVLVASIFYWNIFPVAFVEGSGLTTFKIVSEYVISLILAGAIWLLYRHRGEFSAGVLKLIVASIGITIASEMALTLYSDAYGIANMIGHLLKIASFYLIYRALVQTGLKTPYALLFRNLKQSEERWATTLSSIGDAVVATDPAARVTFMNAVAESLTGWSFREAKGRPITEVLHIVNEKSRQVHDDPVGRVIREGTILGLQNHSVLVRRDGSEVPIDDSGAPIRDEEGNITGVVLVFRDITERRKTEQIKDEFIGLVSHELRTPMTVIQGSLNVAMMEEISPEESKEMLREVLESSEDLSQILDNLVELSRYQSDRLELAVTRTDIADALRSIVEGERTRLNDHRLSLAIAEDLPTIEVDRVRLRHVVRNLLSNAGKYSPANTEINVFARHHDDSIVVGVRDQGSGISVQDQARLFQSFERLRQQSSKKPGLGLGLLVCRRLVEAHGGTIWVESEPGMGSTFFFSLPLVLPAGAA